MRSLVSRPSARRARVLDPAVVARLLPLVMAAEGAATRTTTAPATGAPVAEVPVSTPDDVRRAAQRARSAQPGWTARHVLERAAVLDRVHDLVLDHRDEALDLIQTENGKARAHAYEEVADVALTASWYARQGPAMLADRRYRGLVPGLSRVTQVHHAKGVVGVIAPWNYPLTLAISDALPALLAGNAVVLKPDEQSALTALWGAELLRRAGLPQGLFQVVVGPGDVLGPALVDLVDHVAFTGSTATGRRVAAQAAARLIGASLELGGKNAMYVAEDADLDRAAEAAVRDCFSGTGQMCVSMERLLVHERVADVFLTRFVDRVRRLRLGPGLDYDHDLGCLTSAAQLDRVRRHVEDAVGRGATVLTGGRHRGDLGPLFYEPTVLADVPEGALCAREETFGPVVSVRRVGGDEEAVALANAGSYGLNASVWTADLDRGAAVARRIIAGTVTVNEAYVVAWGSHAAPMGGRRDSGLGRRHGEAGLLRFTEIQSVVVQRAGLRALYALGGERFAALFTAALRTARRTGLPWP